MNTEVVVEEKIRPGHWLGSVLFLPCFDTDGWVTGQASGP